MTDGAAAHARAVRRLSAVSLVSGASAGVVVGTMGLVELEWARWMVVSMVAVAALVATVVLKQQVWGPNFETVPDRSNPLWRVDRVTRGGSFTSALMIPPGLLVPTDMAGSTVLWLAAGVMVATPAVAAACWALRQQASVPFDG